MAGTTETQDSSPKSPRGTLWFAAQEDWGPQVWGGGYQEGLEGTAWGPILQVPRAGLLWGQGQGAGEQPEGVPPHAHYTRQYSSAQKRREPLKHTQRGRS